MAAAAGVDRAQLCGWFMSEDRLFDAEFARNLHRIIDAVPFTADDVPGYAVDVYDS